MSTETGTAPEPGSRERFLAVLKAAADGIVIIDERGVIETVNPAAESLFGFSSPEMVGQSVSMLMPEPHAAAHDTYLARYLATGEAHIIGYGRELTGRRKDGTVFPMDLAVGEGRHAGGRFFVGIARDITHRKALEEALRQREQELRTILESAMVSTASLDAAGSFVEVNAACCQTLGCTEAELVGRDLVEFCHRDDRESVQRVLEQLRRGEPSQVTLRHRCVSQSGEVRQGTLHVALIGGGPADQPHFVAQFVDQTEQLAAEREAREGRERLAHINRLSTLGEMAAGIAHEVNQPLGAISNYAQACRILIEKGAADQNKLLGLLDKVSSQAQRAGEVIRRLRTLAKVDTGLRDLIDVNQAIREVVKLGEVEARLESIPIVLDLTDALPLVAADEIQIQQVVLNLLRNGVDAMRTLTGSPELLLATRLESDEIQVSVRDRGAGIDPSQAADIMSPFFSTKSTGMGMGLAICKSIVTSHGGRLWFEANQDGPGTTFHFTLPVE